MDYGPVVLFAGCGLMIVGYLIVWAALEWDDRRERQRRQFAAIRADVRSIQARPNRLPVVPQQQAGDPFADWRPRVEQPTQPIPLRLVAGRAKHRLVA